MRIRAAGATNPTPMSACTTSPDIRIDPAVGPSDSAEPARRHVLIAEQWFPRPVQEVFAFFADAHNLNDLTPPWLHFAILTPKPIEMGVGTLIDYRIRLKGVPMRWRTRITAWEPGRRFVDEQLRGPYALWRHEHTFEPRDGGTLMRDTVAYALPLAWAPGVALVNRVLVRPDLVKIFAFRREAMARRFGEPLCG